MKERRIGWRKLLSHAGRFFEYVLAMMTILIEIPFYYLGMAVASALKALVATVKKCPQGCRDFILLLKAPSVERFMNNFMREASISRRAERRSRRVVKKSTLWSFAIHEAGHVVLILKSSHQKDLLIHGIIWSRAQQNAARDGHKWGAVRYESSTPFTQEMVLEQLAVTYAGLLAVKCLLNIENKEGHSVSDLRHVAEMSSFFARVVAPGPASAACYAWYLRMLAWRRTKKTLVEERQLVIAIAERLVHKKDVPVSKEEILEIERNITKRLV